MFDPISYTDIVNDEPPHQVIGSLDDIIKMESGRPGIRLTLNHMKYPYFEPSLITKDLLTNFNIYTPIYLDDFFYPTPYPANAFLAEIAFNNWNDQDLMQAWSNYLGQASKQEKYDARQLGEMRKKVVYTSTPAYSQPEYTEEKVENSTAFATHVYGSAQPTVLNEEFKDEKAKDEEVKDEEVKDEEVMEVRQAEQAPEEIKSGEDADNNENGELDGTPVTKNTDPEIFKDTTVYLGKPPTHVYNEKSRYFAPGTGNAANYYSGGGIGGSLRAVNSKRTIFEAGLYKLSKAPRKILRAAFFTDTPLIQKAANKNAVRQSLSRKSVKQIKRHSNAPSFVTQAARNPEYLSNSLSKPMLNTLTDMVEKCLQNNTSLELPANDRKITKEDNAVIQDLGSGKSIPATLLRVFLTCLKYMFYIAAGVVTVSLIVGWEVLKQLKEIIGWLKWLIDKVCAWYGVTFTDVIKEMLKKILQLLWTSMRWGISVIIRGLGAIAKMLYNIGAGFWNNWTSMPPAFNDLQNLGNYFNESNATNTSNITVNDDDDDDDGGDNAMDPVVQVEAANAKKIGDGINFPPNTPGPPDDKNLKPRSVMDDLETVNLFEPDNIVINADHTMTSEAFKDLSSRAANAFIDQRGMYSFDNNTFSFEGLNINTDVLTDIVESKYRTKWSAETADDITKSYTGLDDWKDWTESFENLSGPINVGVKTLIWGMAVLIHGSGGLKLKDLLH